MYTITIRQSPTEKCYYIQVDRESENIQTFGHFPTINQAKKAFTLPRWHKPTKDDDRDIVAWGTYN